MGIASLLGQASGSWRELVTGSSRVELKYNDDGDGGTVYVLRLPTNTPYTIAYSVSRKHLPPNAKLIDGDTVAGMVYLTYHLPKQEPSWV